MGTLTRQTSGRFNATNTDFEVLLRGEAKDRPWTQISAVIVDGDGKQVTGTGTLTGKSILNGVAKDFTDSLDLSSETFWNPEMGAIDGFQFNVTNLLAGHFVEIRIFAWG